MIGAVNELDESSHLCLNSMRKDASVHEVRVMGDDEMTEKRMGLLRKVANGGYLVGETILYIFRHTFSSIFSSETRGSL